MTKATVLRRLGAVALSAALLGLTGCGSDDDTDGTGRTDERDSRSATPSSTPPPSGGAVSTSPTSAGSSTPAPSRVSVPVYFVGPSPTGPRLFAELRTVDATDAVDQALAGLADGPTDPDYTSYLRAGRLRMESYDESAVLVVPDATWTTRPAGLSDRQARLALQQVVLTVQAALGKKIPVGFVTTGRETSDGRFYGVAQPPDTHGFPATRGLGLLGEVNVLTPGQGEPVHGSFEASGLASSFEGTIGWEIRDSGGRRVLDYSCQARRSYVDRLAPWRCAIDVSSLDPGDYTFVARTDSGSTEGPGPTVDSKEITVS